MSGESMGGAGFRSVPGVVWELDQSVASPVAVNTDQVVVVPMNEMWEIINVNVTLTTSAVAGLRVMLLSIVSSTFATYLLILPANNQSPSIVGVYTYAVGIHPIAWPVGGTNWRFQQPIPPKLVLSNGDSIVAGWFLQGAGDQLTGLTVTYRKYRSTTRVSLT